MPRRDASERKIQAADLESKRRPPSGTKDEQRAHVLLHMPSHVRTVPLPEPVDGSWVGWRPCESWEFGLVVAGRLRERRAELALFAGLIG